MIKFEVTYNLKKNSSLGCLSYIIGAKDAQDARRIADTWFNAERGSLVAKKVTVKQTSAE